MTTPRAPGRFRNLVGQTFGYLTVTKQLPSKIVKFGTHALWECQCICGAVVTRTTGKIHAKDRVISCGCMHPRRKHRHSWTEDGKRSPTYNSWANMLQRCTNPDAINYHRYGGRGISVCARWKTFANFLEDMGERPDGTTLDRRENNGNYEKDNCRWATTDQQNDNKVNNVLFEYRGQTYTMAQLRRMAGLTKGQMTWRLRRGGWDVAKAVETPLLSKGQKT